MKTIIPLLTLLLVGGMMPTGPYSMGHVIGACLVSAASLFVLLAVCMFAGYMATRVIQKIDHVAASTPKTTSPAPAKPTVQRAAYLMAQEGYLMATTMKKKQDGAPILAGSSSR